MLKQFPNYLNGEWAMASSWSTNRNPSNLADVIGESVQLKNGAGTYSGFGPYWGSGTHTATMGYTPAGDPRFTANTILAEIAKNHRLSVGERLLYRFAIIPATRRCSSATEHRWAPALG